MYNPLFMYQFSSLTTTLMTTTNPKRFNTRNITRWVNRIRCRKNIGLKDLAPSKAVSSEISPIEGNPLHQNLPEGYQIVEKLVEERAINGATHFRVCWRWCSAKQGTWEPETNLPSLIINDYREMIRAKRALRDVES